MGSNKINSRAARQLIDAYQVAANKSPDLMPSSQITLAALREHCARPTFILLCLALVSLIIGVENIENQDLFWGPLHDSAHTYAMLLLSLILLSLFSSTAGTGANGIVILGAVFVLGIAIELIQPAFGRSASFLDIYYNFVGVTCAGALFAISRREKTWGIKVAAAYLSITIVLSSSLFLPFLGAYTLHKQEQNLPTLLDFEHSWQQRLWRQGGTAHTSLAKMPKGWEENPSTTLHITFNAGKYPGVNFAHPPKDWSEYSQLSFEVFSKLKSTQNLTLRIHDREHSHDYADRYNHTFEIKPGLNRFEIPLSTIKNAPASRTIDMSDIAGLALFMVKPKDSPSLYFDKLRLN